MEAELTQTHGKARGNVVDSDVKALTDAVITLSTSVHGAQQQGCHVQDEEICEILANLDIAPGQPADQEAMKAVQLWGTVEDEHDVVEAMRTHAAEELTALLAGKSIGNDSEVEGEEDEENEEEDDKSTGRGRGAPPSYGELSSHFGILERAAQDSGNADAALLPVQS